MKPRAGKKPPITFSPRDKEILETTKPIVDGIAVLFGENREVLLHSFESLNRSVVYIRNGYVTGHSVGSPITDTNRIILDIMKNKPRRGC
jgi:predicted transcriptional regulator YheO